MPRATLGVAIVLLAAMLAVFASLIIRSHNSEKEDAQNRFAERAQVSAALIEGLFGSTSGTTAVQLARDFSTPEIDQKALDERVEQGGSLFGLITDSEGNLLAESKGTPPEMRDAALTDPSYQMVLEGAPYSLSNYVEGKGGPATDGTFYSLPFPAGEEQRVYVSGLSGPLLASFLGSYLARIPGASKTSSYVIDSEGNVIGSPVKTQPPGSEIKDSALLAALRPNEIEGEYDSGGAQRAFASKKVANSTWNFVLTTKTSDLYAGISSTIEWLILVALALAGLVTVYFLARMLRAAAEVQQAYSRLEVVNVELGETNQELQRSNEELQQFASIASHDLQEPLRKVQSFGDKLISQFGDEIPDEGHDYLRRMRAAAGRMSVLIDDLLRFSRVTTKALPPERVDLARVAREVTTDLDARIAETHGKVEIGPLPTVAADPLQMRQLFQNLIANGVKFHRSGVAPEVLVESVPTSSPDVVCIIVRDNGIGIEPEYTERIFRVFERLHPCDVYEGTGIGLALCRKIVERHRGTIVVESEPGEGSTFTVTLPKVPPPRGLNGISRPSDEREPAHA